MAPALVAPSVPLRITALPPPPSPLPQLLPAYDYGGYKLRDYKIDVKGCSASFFYVTKLSDSMTPRLVQAFYRCNFTLSRPWLTRVVNHLTLLPPGGLKDDEAQVGRVEGRGKEGRGVGRRVLCSCAPPSQTRITAWMSTSQAEVDRWLKLEEDQVKAKRMQGEVAEAEVKKRGELAEKKVLIKNWQKARRRDARDRLLAALSADSV